MRLSHPARLTRLLCMATLSLGLGACATSTDDPNPAITPAERASLQGECVQMADRSQRQACLDKVAFAEQW